MDNEKKSTSDFDTASSPTFKNVHENESDPKEVSLIKEELSNDTKTIVTVILLIFVYPIGFIVMWVWTEWPIWLKTMISLPIIFLIIFFFSLASYFRDSVKQNSRSIFPAPNIRFK